MLYEGRCCHVWLAHILAYSKYMDVINPMLMSCPPIRLPGSRQGHLNAMWRRCYVSPGTSSSFSLSWLRSNRVHPQLHSYNSYTVGYVISFLFSLRVTTLAELAPYPTISQFTISLVHVASSDTGYPWQSYAMVGIPVSHFCCLCWNLHCLSYMVMVADLG